MSHPAEGLFHRGSRPGVPVGRWLAGLALLTAVACQSPASPLAGPTTPATSGASAKPAGVPIKIGAPMSTTGALASYGNEALPAAQIFVDELNAIGGINGRPLLLVHVDDESKPDQTVSAVKRLIQQDHVVAIAGPISSVLSTSASPVANEQQVPEVGCICRYGPITPYEFSVFPISHLVEPLLALAKAQGYTKIGILAQAGPTAETTRETQVPDIEKAMTLVGFEQFQGPEPDLTPQLVRLRAAGAEVIYGAASGAPAATIAKNFKQLNYPGLMWTYAGNANAALLNLLGDARSIVTFGGLKILVYKDLPDSDPAKARLVTFARKYLAKTGREPGTYAAVAYDIMTSLSEAIRVAGDDPRKIRDALEAQTGLQLLNGGLSRSAQEHNGLTPDWLNVRVDASGTGFNLVK